MLRSHLDYKPLDVEAFDLGKSAERAGEGMRDHWRGEHLRGRMGDGSLLPSNKKGKPLGIGRGTIVRGWAVSRLKASKRAGRAAVAPYQGGRYAVAVRMLRRREKGRIVYHTFTGSAAKAMDRIVAAELAQLVRSLSRGGR